MAASLPSSSQDMADRALSQIKDAGKFDDLSGEIIALVKQSVSVCSFYLAARFRVSFPCCYWLFRLIIPS
jgi:hypothetical protein